MEQFVIDEIQNVFSLDALESSHPISIEVGHPDEINEIFDRISYHKGKIKCIILNIREKIMKYFRSVDHKNDGSFPYAQSVLQRTKQLPQSQVSVQTQL
jgi:hypothetical protein